MLIFDSLTFNQNEKHRLRIADKNFVFIAIPDALPISESIPHLGYKAVLFSSTHSLIVDGSKIDKQ
jgi:hypothetical protein